MSPDLQRTLDNLGTKNDLVRSFVAGVGGVLVGSAITLFTGNTMLGLSVMFGWLAGMFACNWVHAMHEADLKKQRRQLARKTLEENP